MKSKTIIWGLTRIGNYQIIIGGLKRIPIRITNKDKVVTRKSDSAKEIGSLTTNLAVVLNQIVDMKDDIRDIKLKLDKEYVTQDQFNPVKQIVYGMVSIVLVGVIGAIVTLVIK